MNLSGVFGGLSAARASRTCPGLGLVHFIVDLALDRSGVAGSMRQRAVLASRSPARLRWCRGSCGRRPGRGPLLSCRAVGDLCGEGRPATGRASAISARPGGDSGWPGRGGGLAGSVPTGGRKRAARAATSPAGRSGWATDQGRRGRTGHMVVIPRRVALSSTTSFGRTATKSQKNVEVVREQANRHSLPPPATSAWARQLGWAILDPLT